MKTKIILLVEDNIHDVKLTLRALEEANILNPVVVAQDGVEALDFLLKGKHPEGNGPTHLPAVVLLDLKLPKVDGLEVLRRIRSEERLRRIPVVILTSSREQEDILKSYDLSANSYIRKPVDFEQFTTAIHQLGLYWLLLNEPPPAETPIA